MGFTCGISRVTNRSGREMSINDYYAIDDYFLYENNKDFYKDQFPTVEDFFNRYAERKSVDMEIVDKFRNDYLMREFTCSIFEPIEDWCSNGGYFHDWIMNNLSEDNLNCVDDSVKLTKEKCFELLTHCVKTLNEIDVRPVVFSRAFTEKWADDCDEVSTITSTPCDGVEVMDEEGNLRRLYGDNFEETDLFILKDSYDKYVAYKMLLSAITKVICDTDWDNQDVFYVGGW